MKITLIALTLSILATLPAFANVSDTRDDLQLGDYGNARRHRHRKSCERSSSHHHRNCPTGAIGATGNEGPAGPTGTDLDNMYSFGSFSGTTPVDVGDFIPFGPTGSVSFGDAIMQAGPTTFDINETGNYLVTVTVNTDIDIDSTFGVGIEVLLGTSTPNVEQPQGNPYVSFWYFDGQQIILNEIVHVPTAPQVLGIGVTGPTGGILEIAPGDSTSITIVELNN